MKSEFWRLGYRESFFEVFKEWLTAKSLIAGQLLGLLTAAASGVFLPSGSASGLSRALFAGGGYVAALVGWLTALFMGALPVAAARRMRSMEIRLEGGQG